MRGASESREMTLVQEGKRKKHARNERIFKNRKEKKEKSRHLELDLDIALQAVLPREGGALGGEGLLALPLSRRRRSGSGKK